MCSVRGDIRVNRWTGKEHLQGGETTSEKENVCGCACLFLMYVEMSACVR